MKLIYPFFYKIRENSSRIFYPKNLVWHALAIALTYFLVVSGFDWWVFLHTRGDVFFNTTIPAALLGFVIPFLLPITLLFVGLRNHPKVLNLAYALTQSAALSWLLSAFYKALTGRGHPMVFGDIDTLHDITRIFKFGILEGGVFWGWPSSHTAVAFAMSLTLFTMVPSKFVRVLVLVYAFYIGISVSITIHWFSDFIAGAIFGALVGLIVGRSYKENLLYLR